ncbi:MAG: hypothetical protein KGP12_09725 [Actinomycetales bacterium]|nr:hypothetical protein [Actinomycetales bacterium]
MSPQFAAGAVGSIASDAMRSFAGDLRVEQAAATVRRAVATLIALLDFARPEKLDRDQLFPRLLGTRS